MNESDCLSTGRSLKSLHGYNERATILKSLPSIKHALSNQQPILKLKKCLKFH